MDRNTFDDIIQLYEEIEPKLRSLTMRIQSAELDRDPLAFDQAHRVTLWTNNLMAEAAKLDRAVSTVTIGAIARALS